MTFRYRSGSKFGHSRGLVGPDAAINLSDVEQFCAVAGNQLEGESIKVARNNIGRAPMDFAILLEGNIIFIPSFYITLPLISIVGHHSIYPSDSY